MDAVSPIRVLRLRQQLKGEKSCVCGLTWRTCANPARVTGDHGRPHPPERRLQAHHSWTAGCQVLERTSVRYMLTFTHPFINFWSNPFVSLGDRRQLLSESLLIFPSICFLKLSTGTYFLYAEARVKDVLVNIPDTRIRNAKLSCGFLQWGTLPSCEERDNLGQVSDFQPVGEFKVRLQTVWTSRSGFLDLAGARWNDVFSGENTICKF